MTDSLTPVSAHTRQIVRVNSLSEHQAGYRVQLLLPGDPAPQHPHLSPVERVVEVDGVTYWVVNQPSGVPLTDIINQGPRALSVATQISLEVGHALCLLHRAGLLPHAINRHIYWTNQGVMLDWPGALLEEDVDVPGTDELPLTQTAAAALAALLHGLLTGKPPVEAPRIFASLNRFGHSGAESLQLVLDAGLSGSLSIDDLVRRLQAWLAEEQLSQAFSPYVIAYSPGDAPAPEAIGNRRWRNDWFVRLLFWAAGLFILLRFA